MSLKKLVEVADFLAATLGEPSLAPGILETVASEFMDFLDIRTWVLVISILLLIALGIWYELGKEAYTQTVTNVDPSYTSIDPSTTL